MNEQTHSMTRLPGTLLGLLLLAGCQRVIFDSPPSAPDCDPALVGSWQMREERDDGDTTQASGTEGAPDWLRIRIDATCRLTGSWTDKGVEHVLAPTTLLTRKIGERSLVWFEHAWANTAFEIDALPIDETPGYYVYRYRVREGRWTLQPFDVERLADRVLSGRWRGDLHKQGETLVVRVTEDSEGTERLLRRAALKPDRDDRIVLEWDPGEVERE